MSNLFKGYQQKQLIFLLSISFDVDKSSVTPRTESFPDHVCSFASDFQAACTSVPLPPSPSPLPHLLPSLAGPAD